MLVLADSGSTKTDWRLIEDSTKIHQFSTQGISPYFMDETGILKMLKDEFPFAYLNLIEESDTSLYFYGSGCGTNEKSTVLANTLQSFFINSNIEVHSDMLGAARSLCGKNEGIAAILGTGSNTCYYNGNTTYSPTPSLGYVLGDEGSGAFIGKKFIEALLNKELPKQLEDNFYQRFQLDKSNILDAVYRKHYPNRFLASFSKFVYQNLKEKAISDLVINCFRMYFDKHICKYPNHKELPVNFTGSVAFYFSNLLRGVASEKGVNIGTITESPIAGLTLYHLELDE